MIIPSPTRAMIVSSVAPPISCAKIRPHGHPRPHQQLDAVFRHGTERRAARFLRVRAIDHFRVNARPHRVEHVAPGQVDRRGPIEVEIDIGPMGCNRARESRAAHCRPPGNALPAAAS